MEKKKKTGEKAKKYENKKEVKVTEKVEGRKKVVFTKSTKTAIKAISIAVTIFATATSLFVLVFGSVVGYRVATMPTEELVNDNFSVSYISKLGGYTTSEAVDAITNRESSALFIGSDIVMPALAFVAVMVILIILAKGVLDFASDINTDDELYNRTSLKKIAKLSSLLFAALTIGMAFFDTPSIIIYLLLCLFMSIILALFKKVVQSQK